MAESSGGEHKSEDNHRKQQCNALAVDPNV
jgi:hypothetical protein